MAISMLKIRRPLGRLIFNMGIAIPGKTVFLIETAPRKSPLRLLAGSLPIPPLRSVVLWRSGRWNGLFVTYIWHTVTLWCQNLSQCQNISLHEQRHIPEEDCDQSVSGSNEPEQQGNIHTFCAVLLDKDSTMQHFVAEMCTCVGWWWGGGRGAHMWVLLNFLSLMSFSLH